jgi:hypothetical protein
MTATGLIRPPATMRLGCRKTDLSSARANLIWAREMGWLEPAEPNAQNRNPERC